VDWASIHPLRRPALFWSLFAIGMAVLFAVIFLVIDPPPGPALAATPVESAKPFTLQWVADGNAARAWLDVDTEWVAFPIEGHATITAGSRRVATERFDVSPDGGYAVSGTTLGSREIIEGHLLFDIPSAPAGTPMRIEGILMLHPQTVTTSTDPRLNSSTPPPHRLRFWVAR